jgi:hypothetical protein
MILLELQQNTLPPNHVWVAARYCAPDIVAHQSALQGGVLLEVPDFGLPPSYLKIVYQTLKNGWVFEDFTNYRLVGAGSAG